MSRNIIDAIVEIINCNSFQLSQIYNASNRVNASGEALEIFVKDLFAGTVGMANSSQKNTLLSNTFSYLGNNSNPPDAILKKGDAIEIKKIETNNAGLALNSSYPKDKLYSNDTMISKDCKVCEDDENGLGWDVKDMIYAVGVMEKSSKNIKSLAFVYGVDYCADREVYLRIKNTIKAGVEEINGVEFAETRELGRINRVDPLGITFLRVRGMWEIVNPFVLFEYIYKRNPEDHSFDFMAIINKNKLQTLDNYEQLKIMAKNPANNLAISSVKIKNPNNPADLKDAVLVTHYRRK